MRPSRSIPLCLALGALITTAIAWALALWPTLPRLTGWSLPIDISPTPLTARGIHLTESRRPGSTTFLLTTRANAPQWIGPAWSPERGTTTGEIWTLHPSDQPLISEAIAIFPDIRGTPHTPNGPPSDLAWPTWLPPIPESPNLIAHGGRASGWPFPTFRALIDVPKGAEPILSSSLHLLPTTLYQDQDPFAGAIPLHPIPLPFLLSTLMWATALWLLLFAPRTLRHHLRGRRGQCPACGYNLHATPTTAPCPECGSLVTNR